MNRRLTLTALLVLLAALALAPSASSRGDAGLKIRASLNSGGPYSNEDLLFSMSPGDKRNIYLKVKNKSGSDQKNVRFDFAWKAAPDAFKVRVFRGRTDITQAIRDGKKKFNLDQGDSAKFRAKVKQNSAGGMAFLDSTEKPGVGDDEVYGEINTAP